MSDYSPDTTNGYSFEIVSIHQKIINYIQGFIGLTIVLLNVLIISVLCKETSINFINTVMKNLAFADTLVGIVIFTRATIVLWIADDTFSYSFMCDCLVVIFVLSFNSAQTFVLLLSIEMYIAVRKRMTTTIQSKSKFNNYIYVAVCWIIWIVYSLGHFVFQESNRISTPYCLIISERYNKYLYILTLIFQIISFLSTGTIHILTLKLVKKQFASISPVETISETIDSATVTSRNGNNSSLYFEKARRMTFTVSYINIISICTCLPVVITALVIITERPSYEEAYLVFYHFYSLAMMSCFCNVFIYTFRSRQFRQALRTLFKF